MADSASSAQYLEKAEDVRSRLKARGLEIVFGSSSESDSLYESDGRFKEIGRAYAFPLEWIEDFSDDVQKSDLFFIVSNDTDITCADQCYFVSDAEEKDVHRLMKAEPFKPDGVTVIYYEIQIRK